MTEANSLTLGQVRDVINDRMVIVDEIKIQLTASGMQLTAALVDILSEICYVRITGNRKQSVRDRRGEERWKKKHRQQILSRSNT